MQTRELVPQHLHKEFMRLVILMSTQKSHFAYRLAWENSPSDRIPFLPLHRRDLVGAEEGNKTFIGEDKSRINWRKFEVMGEILLGIQRSQKTPYTHMYRSEDAMQLILETHVSGDDEVGFCFFSCIMATYCLLLMLTYEFRISSHAAYKSNQPLAMRPVEGNWAIG